MLVKSNVHEREYPVPAARLGDLLDTLAGPDDRIWPKSWPPMRFDRPLAVGARGGHGKIAYSVRAYQPGRLVDFRFDDAMPMTGTHGMEVRDGDIPGTSVLRHSLIVTGAGGIARIVIPLTIEKLHDAVLEDLLDRVGDEVGEPPAKRARWSLWVRMLRMVLARRR